ncbi:MAG TPA: lipid II flippase MurJ, partial [Trebonia sp.]|nr:lipid II flippase MurJ [Trebonia sp.]
LGLRLRPTWHFPPGAATTIRRMALSGAVVLGSQDLATAVVLRLANQQGTGGAVVIYNLAWTVFTVPWAVAAVPLATSAFPALTAAWQSADRAGYAGTVSRTSRVLVVAVAAAAAVMVATSGPAARVVILGAPGHVAPQVLARGLAAFAPGLLGYGLIALLSRALYAQGDARTPAVAAMTGWLVAIGADIGLVAALPRSWTVAAFGIGTAVGVSMCAGWLLLALRRTAGAGALGGLGRAGAAAIGSGAVAAGCGWLLAGRVHGSGVLLNLAVGAGVAVVTLAVHLGLAAVVDRRTIQLLFARGRLRRA